MNTISEAYHNAFIQAMKEAGVNESEVSSVMKKMEKKFIPEVKEVVRESLEKAIKVAKETKDPKDPNAPKKARSAYQMFCSDVRENTLPIKETKKMETIFGKANISTVQTALKAEKIDMSGLADLWKLVTEKGKEIYSERAKEDKGRFEEESKSYVPVPVVKAPTKPASNAFELYYRETCTKEWQKEHDDLSNAKERRAYLKEQWEEESKDTQTEYAERVKADKATYKKVLVEFESELSEEEREVYKAKTDKNAPKKARSAYIIFSTMNREEAKNLCLEENPDEAVEPTDVMKKLGEMWKDISEKEKEKYANLAEKDKARYESEMELYKKGEYKAPEKPKATKAGAKKSKDDSDSESDGKSEEKKSKKTGYMCFMTYRKKQLAEENEEMSKKEIQEMAVQEWKDLDEKNEESGKAFWKKVASGEIELEDEEDERSSSKASTASDSKSSKASKASDSKKSKK